MITITITRTTTIVQTVTKNNTTPKGHGKKQKEMHRQVLCKYKNASFM
jgi:hypothetical protein